MPVPCDQVQHLQEEMDSMRFTKDELRNQAAGMGAAEAMPDAETQGSRLSRLKVMQ